MFFNDKLLTFDCSFAAIFWGIFNKIVLLCFKDSDNCFSGILSEQLLFKYFENGLLKELQESADVVDELYCFAYIFLNISIATELKFYEHIFKSYLKGRFDFFWIILAITIFQTFWMMIVDSRRWKFWVFPFW